MEDYCSSTTQPSKDDSMVPPSKFSFEDDASFWSRLFLMWMNDILKLGAKRRSENSSITVDDLGSCRKNDSSGYIWSKFDAIWRQELADKRDNPSKKLSLWHGLFCTVTYSAVYIMISCHIIYSFALFGPPIILNYLVDHFSGTSELNETTMWVLVLLLLVLPIIACLLFVKAYSLGMWCHVL
jgi:hypothetical protein